ncbi:hypothetical protein J2X69_002033 [Algoriphagus sp. 4150]|uniref:hypothetical protein n=1 Tax=Algoriphagus sp. 4150 TaxID=2817756 RepID=UPI002858E3BF|nr:hypothetical protein [Algoriphagus sp. 4150]MDR7129688.1 hypothetical protein [Algoriphagus sp. 4150]
MDLQQGSNFEVGDLVYDKKNPETKLIIRKYYAGIYYCTFADFPMKKELALFERELLINR